MGVSPPPPPHFDINCPWVPPMSVFHNHLQNLDKPYKTLAVDEGSFQMNIPYFQLSKL